MSDFIQNDAHRSLIIDALVLTTPTSKLHPSETGIVEFLTKVGVSEEERDEIREKKLTTIIDYNRLSKITEAHSSDTVFIRGDVVRVLDMCDQMRETDGSVIEIDDERIKKSMREMHSETDIIF